MSDAIITTQDFEKLFREYYSRLYYFAYDFVEDIEVSKDIVSEIFTIVWNNRGAIDQEKVVGYLFVSVRNKCLNYIKQKHKYDEYVDFYQQVIDEEGDNDWETLENRISEMTQVIDKMTSRTRYILEECYFRHKKYKEVADDLGITTDGIKKHITKALSLLREHFNVNKDKGRVPD
jgi:RNA polymerase sigma-70 factor (family 1)